jgi:hypothetical protein
MNGTLGLVAICQVGQMWIMTGVPSSRFKVQGSRFKVQGSRFKVQGSRFKVQGSKGIQL